MPQARRGQPNENDPAVRTHHPAVVGLAIAVLPLAVAMWWENWERRTVVGEDRTEIEDRTEMRKADPIRRAA